MHRFEHDGKALSWRLDHQRLRLEPWGTDSVRVRAGLHGIIDGLPGALEAEDPSSGESEVRIGEDEAVLRVGALEAVVSAAGQIVFRRSGDGTELLREQPAHAWWPGARHLVSTGGGRHRLEQRFAAYEDERLFGLGQHMNGRFDQKGMVLELLQRNGEVSIPFAVSSRGYGFLWNLPAVGRVELSTNGTRWVADSARQIDYWVTTGAGPADILAHYADATGHSPELPEWASGFWQSKLRYSSQEELLAVAREYHRRGLPLAVIVADYFHWRHLGDWSFDPAAWPDPAAMVKELAEMGTRLMVSVWPSVSPLSVNHRPMLENGLLIATNSGAPAHVDWPDDGTDAQIGLSFYDATNPQARDYIWRQVHDNYYADGVRTWWLDACEPEMRPGHPHNLTYAAGPGDEVANLYPREHARAFYEGMRDDGETEVLSLVRSAWAGSQRYGVALWSGDIPATFQALADSVRAGLNVAMSGIPWWTTDIGGFHGGDPDDESYRELVVRWFQFSAFCPLFRLHGHREPRVALGPVGVDGGPNEVWSYGPDAYAAIVAMLQLRERLRPYLHEQLSEASARGLPLMRPLLLAFPADPVCWEVEDQFLCGNDILVAPVTELGARSRLVYLPAGATWTAVDGGACHDGGQWLGVAAPLHSIPLFLRDNAQPPVLPPVPASP
ncbi:MAG: alpha-D-xyloside xylohydrolase [Frankiales bacterium]|nr:alpha-D-xyloside xylohydrolase [Frankiales bacterium]